MELNEMSKEERSLLIYFETRAVDYGGRVDIRRMNKEDMDIADNWNTIGFIEFGRIKFHDIESLRKSGYHSTHWCKLSDEAWDLAHKERKNRYDRMIEGDDLKYAILKD